MLDLGYPGDAHPHGGGDLLLAQAELLAGLSELVPARLGKQPARTRLGFLGGDPGGEATTQNLISKHGLQFPVGHSADAAAVAARTGAFVNPDPRYLQSTGFVLDPGGRIVVSVYSSGAIGRLVPQDVIGLVRYLHEHAPAGQ